MHLQWRAGFAKLGSSWLSARGTSKQKNKRACDARRRGAVFRPGQFVYVWTPSRARAKQQSSSHRYHGPFRLLRQVAESERECSVRVDTTVPQRGAAVPPASDHGQSEHSTSATEVYFDPRTQYRAVIRHRTEKTRGL
ncbi:hypothetical protein MRX96_036625 [Rhipicephalus microplus]